MTTATSARHNLTLLDNACEEAEHGKLFEGNLLAPFDIVVGSRVTYDLNTSLAQLQSSLLTALNSLIGLIARQAQTGLIRFGRPGAERLSDEFRIRDVASPNLVLQFGVDQIVITEFEAHIGGN